MTVTDALADFIERYLAATRTLTHDLPRQPFDPDWPSLCQVGEPEAGLIRWQPVVCDPPPDFSGLEHALDTPLHPDITQYYGSFWSDSLPATHNEGLVDLILLWNAADFERLVGNVIGHALAKRRARQPLTVFFACTEPDSELFLSVDNQSGKVLLEYPGRPPEREIAPSLADFIRQLHPAPFRAGG